MYAILCIETGEYLYRDCHGNLLLLSELHTFINKNTFKLATYKYSNTAHTVLSENKQFIIIQGRDVKLNNETKALFEVVEYPYNV